MPVSLNEPLSALQRLCEELEYSELLDEADQLDNVFDRMVSHAWIVYHNCSMCVRMWIPIHSMVYLLLITRLPMGLLTLFLESC